MAKTYSEKLKDPKWQRRRLEILNRDNFTCQLCGDNETELQVHHLKYEFNKEPWDYPLTNLVAYCKHCHTAVEHLKKKETYVAIKCHKRFCNDTKIYILLVLLKSEDKLRVAITSFDFDDFQVHSTLGPNTIKHMAALIEQNSDTMKTIEHG